MFGGLLPDFVNLVEGKIHFAVRVVAGRSAQEAQVERRFAAFTGNFEHVVFARIDTTFLQRLRPRSKFADELLQLPCAWRANDLWFPGGDLRHGQFEHVGRLNIRDLPELLHQLRNIYEPGKSCIQSVARCVGR